MLETGHSRPTTKRFLAFVPRQVSLANSKRANMKNEKASPETLETELKGDALTMKSSKKEKKQKKNKKERMNNLSPLLLSIAAFLKQQGFSRTLATFQSEASIEELDGYKVQTVDFETFYKYLETSQYDEKADLNEPEELDFQKDGITYKDKDRKKKKSKPIDTANADQGGTESLTETLKGNSRYSVSLQGECNDSSIMPLEDIEMKSKNSKKKKNKMILNSVDEDIGGGNPENMKVAVKRISKGSESSLLVTENGYGNIHPGNKHVKSKDKKRKNKLISESSVVEEDIGKTNTNKENILEESAVSIERMSYKKRKKLAAENDGMQPNEEIASKKAKQGKIEGSQEEKGNDNRNPPSESEYPAGKRKKIENGDVDLTRCKEISPGKQFDSLTDGKEHPKELIKENMVFGGPQNSGTVGSATQMSIKKQRNGSAEPKTVNAFQRVKVDKVKFADERLQDNSYWAKDGAENGYGAKAQEVLGQVKGRDFRHEKTKKKRGSYRGGQIDLQTHSIKFQYSDDE